MVWTKTAALGLAMVIPLGCAAGAGSPTDDEPDRDGVAGAGPEGALALEPRDGSGALRFEIKTPDGTIERWESELTCDYVFAGPLNPQHTELARYWERCTVPDVDGHVSFLIRYLKDDDDVWRLQTELDNGLSGDAKLISLAYVFRVAGAALGSDPNSVYARFYAEDWIQDPARNMRLHKENPFHAALGHKPPIRDENGDLYVNRNKATPALSLHTPNSGLLVHTTDPANADTGMLIMGGGETEDGDPRLDFGYQILLEHPAEPPVGLQPIGPELRAVVLPGGRAPQDSWWDAVEAYDAYLESPGVSLLPEHPLRESPEIAPWATECVYGAWNVAVYDPEQRINVVRANQSMFSDLPELVAHHREVMADDEVLHVCPLLWSLVTYAPYAIGDDGLELLANLEALDDELENVEIHPMFYVASGCAHPGAGLDPDAFVEDPPSWGCFHEPGAKTVKPWHPAVQEELRRFSRWAFANGFEGIYHDAPFGEHENYYGNGGFSRRAAEGYRENIKIVNQELARIGGGAISVEDGRLGLDAIQSRQPAVSYMTWDDGAGVPFTSALLHHRLPIGMAGADPGLGLLAADADHDPIVKASCAPDPGKPADPMLGTAGARNHMPRAVMTPAVNGAVVMQAPDFPVWKARNTPIEAPFFHYARVQRAAAQLRRDVPALRYGKHVQPPQTDAKAIDIPSRMQVGQPGNQRWSCRILNRPSREVEYAFYEDPDRDDALVFVMGNAMPGPRTLTVYFDAADHPRMANGFVVLDAQGEELGRASTTLTLEVPLDAYSFGVLSVVGG